MKPPNELCLNIATAVQKDMDETIKNGLVDFCVLLRAEVLVKLSKDNIRFNINDGFGEFHACYDFLDKPMRTLIKDGRADDMIVARAITLVKQNRRKPKNKRSSIIESLSPLMEDVKY